MKYHKNMDDFWLKSLEPTDHNSIKVPKDFLPVISSTYILHINIT